MEQEIGRWQRTQQKRHIWGRTWRNSLMRWCHITLLASAVNCLGDHAQFSAMILRVHLRVQHVLWDNLCILGCIEWEMNISVKQFSCFFGCPFSEFSWQKLMKEPDIPFYRLGLGLHGRDSLNVQICNKTAPNLFAHRSPWLRGVLQMTP